MESLYHETNKLLQHVQSNQLSVYEQARGSDAVSGTAGVVQQQLSQVAANCERLEVLVSKEPVARRSQAKYRVEQLKYDYRHLAAAAQQIEYRHEQRRAEDRQRDELLTRRFTRNSDGDHSIMMDHVMSEKSSLADSHRAMDDMLTSGRTVLDNLRQQKYSLKNIHAKMLDIVNVLGMSNTVMRLIEKRSTQDKIIMLVGMVTTLIIMFLLWKYFLK